MLLRTLQMIVIASLATTGCRDSKFAGLNDEKSKAASDEKSENAAVEEGDAAEICDDSGNHPEEILGKWTSKCGPGQSQIHIHSFSNCSAKLIVELYTDMKCDKQIGTQTFIYSYDVGKVINGATIKTLAGNQLPLDNAYDLDIVLVKATEVFLTDEVVQSRNKDNYLDISDWKINEERDVTGAPIRGSDYSGNIPKKGDSQILAYSIFQSDLVLSEVLRVTDSPMENHERNADFNATTALIKKK